MADPIRPAMKLIDLFAGLWCGFVYTAVARTFGAPLAVLYCIQVVGSIAGALHMKHERNQKMG